MCSLTDSDIFVHLTRIDNTRNCDHSDGFTILDKSNVNTKSDSYLTCQNSGSIDNIAILDNMKNRDHSDGFTILDKTNLYAKTDSNLTCHNFR